MGIGKNDEHLENIFEIIDDIVFKKNQTHSGWWGLPRETCMLC